MKLSRIEINNFKSFGDCDNLLFVDMLNVVVGKNESGKSNIIDAISGIEEIGSTPKIFFEKRNKNSSDNVKIKLWLDEAVNDERLKGSTVIELNNFNDYVISGSLAKYIENNNELKNLFQEIIELNESGLKFSNPNNQRLTDELIYFFSNMSNKILIIPEYFGSFLKTLDSSNNLKHRELSSKFRKISLILDDIYLSLPYFLKINNLELKSKYSVNKLDEDLLLNMFLEICEIDLQELKKHMQLNDTSKIRNYERRINKKVESNFTDSFNKFYSQEELVVELAINNGELSIMIDTSKTYLDYDERSNGLKWYLNIFIQLLHKERKNCSSFKNNIILIDEPGVYLHANAQKKLYALFKELTKNENQIIYTTHSPFMIDNNELQNVRAVIKDKDGFSHIYNKITTIPTNDESTYDTISPLLYALGLDLNYNIGPNVNKKNIIVEGLSDYFYLQSYFKVKKISEKDIPNIIPSTGADNIFSIASILYGWGCDFVMLFDQDEKGRAKYDSLYDQDHPFVEKLLFVDGTNEKNDVDCEIENLFSESDREIFGLDNSDYDDRKYNYSYLMYCAIIRNERTLDSKTIKNFDKLKLL